MTNDDHSFTFAEKIRSIFALFILAIAFISGGILAAVFGLVTFFQFTNFVVTIFGKMIGGVAFFLLGLKLDIKYHGELPQQAVYIFNTNGKKADLEEDGLLWISLNKRSNNPYYNIENELVTASYILQEN